MKRDKNVKEKGNLLIYAGTAIFFILAILIGIVVYNTTKTNSNNENNIGSNIEENQEIQETESASTEIGKTVEEQQNSVVEEKEINETTENVTTTEDNTTVAKPTNANSNTSTEKEVKVEENVTENKVTETKKELTFIKPTEGEIICEYAKDNLIYSETLKEWVTHTAIDIKADKTSVIKSSAEGVVKSIVNDPRYGLTVIIEHDDGYETVYSNLLTAEFVVEGEELEQGQTIGTAGNTASFESEMDCHLHFELLKDGEYLDPSIYLK